MPSLVAPGRELVFLALGDTREFVGVEGGQNKNERAEAAGTSGSNGETRKTTASFAPR